MPSYATFALSVLALVLFHGTACAQNGTFGLSGLLYFPPEEDAFLSPILAADRGALHLEARYNYEDLRTGSMFVGRNFAIGDELVLTATPMLGLVIGQTDGIAPGLELDLAWRSLELYSESEYVVRLDDVDEDFFYQWLEATVAPASWIRFGLVTQRTRTIETGLDLERGLLLESTYRSLSVGVDWFNPDREDDQYFVLSAGYEF
ncbi:MAG: hypothetical protein ACREOU_11545 [Candidatus Eiseniibacteriota bacterium]